MTGRGSLTVLLVAGRRCGRLLTSRTFTDVAGELAEKAPDLAELMARCAQEVDVGTVKMDHA